MNVPFNKSSLVGKELIYIKEAVRRGQLSGDGTYTARVSKQIVQHLGVLRVLLTPSCTQALELAYLTLGIKPAGEVILPSFTFPSTANAFMLCGAKPVFVDIRPDTLNIDENRIEEKITLRTRVISPVHYGGMPCQMDVIMRLARKHRVEVVEDAAQSYGAEFKGKKVGSFGVLSAVSFHQTKNIASGEGGALLINDSRLFSTAEVIRQNGTNRAAFIRGKVKQYGWERLGSSYIPSELQAAVLAAQLEKAGEISKKRKKIFNFYNQALLPLEQRGWIQLPPQLKDRTSSNHIFYVLFENLKTRNRVMQRLNAKGIHARSHYFPLHLSSMGRKLGYRPGQFPVTERASDCLLRLPLYNTMTGEEQFFVINTLKHSI